MRRLFEGGTYLSNYCNLQLKSLLHLGQNVITFRTLLHLGQNVITFRTLLHLGSFITFRPSTPVTVGHLQSWSRIFRSNQTEMVRSIWWTNQNFRNFGLKGKRPYVCALGLVCLIKFTGTQIRVTPHPPSPPMPWENCRALFIIYFTLYTTTWEISATWLA